jgi:two-component system, LuxR family, response regulator FixJ
MILNIPADPIVHVIDDDDAVRGSLVFLLETADLCVRSYASALDFLDQVSDTAAGCVITDVRMPGMTGLELVRRLNARGAVMPVIVITGHADVALAVEAMRAGVFDFIEKPFEDQMILSAVSAALHRGLDQYALSSERSLIVQRVASLSTRERQVLDGLVAGQSNKAVAQILEISPRTVEVYRANLMTKMQAASLSDLVRMALVIDTKSGPSSRPG